MPAPLRDLVRAVATGRDPPPEPLPGRRRLVVVRSYLRRAAPILAVLTALIAARSLEPYGVGTVATLIVAVLSALPLVLLRYDSLLAWRAGWLATLVSAASGLREAGAPWPANPVLILVYFLVLAVVAYRQPAGVLVWVWSLSASLIWVFLPLATAPGATLLITVLLLPSYLLRRWAQVRGRLTAEQERGAVLTERARIARELHDVVAHHMSLIAVRAETAPYRLAELPGPARDEFAEISMASRDALAEMRRLLPVLRSEGEQAPIGPQPGLADLDALVAAARAAGTPVAVQVEGELTGMPAAADLSAYRIVQESLSNAARHAAGAAVQLIVRRTADELLVRVSSGAGRAGPRAAAETEASPGQGVRGMRERVSMLGGQLSASPTRDGGFDVRATIPLKPPGT